MNFAENKARQRLMNPLTPAPSPNPSNEIKY